MYDTNMENLGKKIKYFRKSKNISAEELGRIIGKSKTTINRYESSEILPDILTTLEICNALNIDLNNICDMCLHNIEKDSNINPFNSNLLYLYYMHFLYFLYFLLYILFLCLIRLSLQI